jgi:hypothetical protein
MISFPRIVDNDTMESTAFFEKKINITPSDFNEMKTTTVDDILTKKAKAMMENKCSEHGFILPGSIKLHSRSMGYFEAARFTGDAIYYGKLEAKVIYPVDGIRVTGEVIRKNKMGLYVNYQNAIHIQVPRDLHLGNETFDNVQVGDYVQVELKRSKFAVNDLYILSSGLFIDVISTNQVVASEVSEVSKVPEVVPEASESEVESEASEASEVESEASEASEVESEASEVESEASEAEDEADKKSDE